jgi:tellurite resistance protein TerC
VLQEYIAVGVLAQDSLLAIAPAQGKMIAYAGFIALVIGALALDLGVFHKRPHEVSIREAASWSAVWVATALLFSWFVYEAYERHWLGLGLDTPMYSSVVAEGAGTIVRGEVNGMQAFKQYITGYIVEKSLSLDNIFVIALVFGYFAVPAKFQHRVLFWGILGALVMRGAMIFVGAELVHRFDWVLIFFGLFLIFTALKMALIKSHDDPGSNPVVRLATRLLPVTARYHGSRFFVREGEVIDGQVVVAAKQRAPGEGGGKARLLATPLFLALIMVEVTDVVFAVDSVPAIFAITPDPFIVFTSNIFAILGLRSLYFCLAAVIGKFRFLKPGLVLILLFIGVKLLLLSGPPYVDNAAALVGIEMEPLRSIKIDTGISLAVIGGTLTAAIVGSLLVPFKRKAEETSAGEKH